MQYYFFILKSPILCPFRDLKNDNLLPKLSLFAYTYIENDMNVKYLFIYYMYHCSLTSNLVNFEFPDTFTTDSESSWSGDFENNLEFAVTSCAIKIYTRVLYHEFFNTYLYKDFVA